MTVPLSPGGASRKGSRIARSVLRRVVLRGSRLVQDRAPAVLRVLLPRGSRRRHAVEVRLEALVRAPDVLPPETPPGWTTLTTVPHHPEPLLTILVASWNNLDYTLDCLASIAADRSAPPYEVVVVDDASESATAEALATVKDISLLALTKNVGYLRACNSGLRLATGRFLLLLNNDVQLLRGCLNALVARASSDASIGAVGAQLIYPTGVLQEAGSIVFNDGSAWNYGHGENPRDAEYRFAREVDYCSAACLLVDRDLLIQLGGYDERYAPAFYEDTDLCFAIRSRGRRVVYEPKARAIHHGGISHGTDETTGLKAHQVRNRAIFQEKWPNELDQQFAPSSSTVALARDRRRGPRVLVVDHRLPAPDRDSGSVRIWAVLQALLDEDCAVHFVPADNYYDDGRADRLESSGIEVLDTPASFRRFLRSMGEHVDIAWLCRAMQAGQYGPLVRRQCPRATVVFDTVDLHGPRMLEAARRAPMRGAMRNARRIDRLERRAIAESDVTVVVTSEEAEKVRALPRHGRIHTIPNVHSAVPGRRPSFDRRSGIVFVGGFEHPPNVDALEYLIDDMAPLLARCLPGVQTMVVGADAPAALVRRAPSNVEFLGWVPHLLPVYDRARLSIAPLRYGAGMKGKVGDAMAASLPVVTTPVGAEGFGAESGRQLIVADDPESFVAAVVEAYENEAIWETLSNGGRAFIEERFSTSTGRERVRELLGLVSEVRPTGIDRGAL